MNRITRLTVLLLTAALLFGMGCNAINLNAASAKETVDKTFPLQPGGSFSLENVNGAITLTEWSQPEVRVLAFKKVKGSDDEKAREFLEKVEIVFEASEDAVRVDTIFPKKKGFSLFGGCCSAAVTYEIQVPPRTRVTLETVNGSVTVDAETADLRVESVNGALSIERAAELNAATVNGKISFTANGLHSVETTNGAIVGTVLGPQTGSASVETVNGKINLTLGAGLSAEVEGDNVNGRVSCDIDGFTVKKHSLGGTWNGGGPAIRLETVNGSIRVGTSE